MDRRSFLATATPRFKMSEIIERMNWLAEQDADMRAYLRALCEHEGHVPTGERIMVNPPIHTCWRCGEEFRR